MRLVWRAELRRQRKVPDLWPFLALHIAPYALSALSNLPDIRTADVPVLWARSATVPSATALAHSGFDRRHSVLHFVASLGINWIRRTMDATIYTVGELMYELVSGTGPVRPGNLHCLADLSVAELAELRDFWLLIARRRRIQVAADCLHLLRNTRALQFKALFVHLLTDPVASVRELAVEGLGLDVYPDTLPQVELIASQDVSDTVRRITVQTLGQFLQVGEVRFWEERVVMRIRENLALLIASADQSLALQCSALESLGYSPGPIYGLLLSEAYRSDLEELRVSALVAMGRSHEPQWEDLLLEACEDQSLAVRTAAIQAGGMLELAVFRNISLHVIELETDSQLRLAAIEALGRLGGPIAQEGLLLAAESDDPEQQEAVLRVLENQQIDDATDIA